MWTFLPVEKKLQIACAVGGSYTLKKWVEHLLSMTFQKWNHAISHLSFKNCDDKSSYLSSRPTQYWREAVLRELSVSKIAVVFGPANIPFVASPSQEAFNVHFTIWFIFRISNPIQLPWRSRSPPRWPPGSPQQLEHPQQWSAWNRCPRSSPTRPHRRETLQWFLLWAFKSASLRPGSVLSKVLHVLSVWVDLIWGRHLGCPQAAGKHSWSGCWCSVGRPTLQVNDEHFLKSWILSDLLSVWICPNTVLQVPVGRVVLGLVVLRRKCEAKLESMRYW